MKLYLQFLLLALIFTIDTRAQQSVARQWNEVMLSAIREDLARPPVQARNLFHVSIAMYDAWAAYDAVASTYLIGKTVNGIFYPYSGISPVNPALKDAARNRAISYAAYRVLLKRYELSPNATSSLSRFHNLMITMGYDTAYRFTDYVNGTPADLGNFIASQVIQMGLTDNAREAQNYSNADYQTLNPALHTDSSGNNNMPYPNNWQRLFIVTAIDQNGIPIGSLQNFICPEWGRVGTFALAGPTNYTRNGHVYPVYNDPGTPPLLDTLNVADSSSYYFKWGHSLVSTWSSHLSPDDNVMWDISPNAMGNVQSLPTTLAGQHNFYNFLQGGDPGLGYSLNPVSGSPYTPQIVKRGDYTRVITQFWADGPNSETPPGHWYVLLNQVSDYPGFQKKYEGTGPVLNNLEWDVKSYFTLGGAMHDAAIAAWGIKGWYDSPRPLSVIRKMALYGQSSDPLLPSYHAGGIPLVPGYIELVNAGDPLAGIGNINVGKIKIKAWRGYSFIPDPNSTYAGVGWILASDWMPYQRKTFVTPPFAGYISGHSTYSRAAAEVLTAITGTSFFPGGMGTYFVPANSNFLGFETGPTTNIQLQWATYQDASNQCSLSRIWGGIHPPFDDIPGRLIGKQIGIASHAKARTYFIPIILPIVLSSFSATENTCRVDLQWTTSFEQNSAYYTILRSGDGINFNTVAVKINSAGNASTPKNYKVSDANPLKENYYKLIQTDKDGKFTEFQTLHVSLKNCPSLANDYVSDIVPNPVRHQAGITVSHTGKVSELKIIIVNVLGRSQIVQTQKLLNGANKISFSTEQLTPGFYFARIIIDGELTETRKLVKSF